MLPVELWEHVLQEVRLLDWQSVKNCSLVFRTLLPLARQILFRRVILSLEPNSSNSSTPRSTLFAKFLVEGAHVASSIQDFCLEEKRSGRTGDARDWQTNATYLSLLLPKLGQVQRVSIRTALLSDWTSKNNELRSAIMQLCLLSTVQSVELAFVRLKQEELLSFLGVPKLALLCVDILPEGLVPSNEQLTTEIVSSQSPSAPPSTTQIRLRDLTITPQHLDNHLPAVWSIMKAAGSSLASLKCYSSPFHDFVSDYLNEIDLRRHPHLLSFAVCIPLTVDGGITKITSLFSRFTSGEAPIRGTIRAIEICCDVDLHNFPSEETISVWEWRELDAIFTSITFERLERVEITVKKVIRSRGTRTRKYRILEERVLGVFRDHLPIASQRGLVVAGPLVEEDGSIDKR